MEIEQSDLTDFLWGVSTSAFQIEGDTINDMTEWEGSGGFHQNGKNPLYKNAARHWKMWEDDYRLLKELSVNAYRFSMEWGRIQPEPGKYSRKALDQYSRMVDRLLELQITPMLTLHHFTHPVWFHKKTPWHTPESIGSFLQFAEKLVKRFADRISLFITFNEPLVWALAAYGDAKFPPGEKNLARVMDALFNMLQAHRQTYDLIKGYNPEAQIGIAKNFIIFSPQRRWHPFDSGLNNLIHFFYNIMVLEAFKINRLRFKFPALLYFDKPIALDDCIDFWGINYYYRMHVKFRLNLKLPFQIDSIHRSGEGMSDLNWEIYSKGLWQVLKWVRPTGKPIYITEHGIADAEDYKRLHYLKSVLQILQEAKEKGYPIKGYFHWSLMDNYEWLEGSAAKFGLYEVDYNNGYKRILRQSGKHYSEFIEAYKKESVHSKKCQIS